MDSSVHSNTASILKWLQTSAQSDQLGHQPTHTRTVDATISQPQDTPPKPPVPINVKNCSFVSVTDQANSAHGVNESGFNGYHGSGQTSKDCRRRSADQDEAEVDHNPYARRPRRKTRPDKYDFREEAKNDAALQDTNHQQRSRKRKRKETSGSALLHRYTAENVKSERLTLRPTSNLGLFVKGKASSSFRQKALPDLAFSEVKFLPQRSTALIFEPRCRDKRSAAGGIRDEDLSRFFSGGNLGSTVQHVSLKEPISCADNRNISEMDVTVPIDTPPFLGFGKLAPRGTAALNRSDHEASIKPLVEVKQSQSQFSWSHSPTTIRTRLRRSRKAQVLNVEADSDTPRPQDRDEQVDQLGVLRRTVDQGVGVENVAQDIMVDPAGRSATFFDELSNLVEKWRTKTGRRVPQTELQLLTEQCEEYRDQLQGPRPTNIDSAVQQSTIHHEIKNPTGIVGNDKIGNDSMDMEMDISGHNQIQSVAADHILPQQSHDESNKGQVGSISLLPQRIPSTGHVSSHAQAVSSLLKSSYLSMPVVSIYEQQFEAEKPENLASEVSKNTSAYRFNRRSSSPFPLYTDITSPCSIPSRHVMRRDRSTTQDSDHRRIYTREMLPPPARLQRENQDCTPKLQVRSDHQVSTPLCIPEKREWSSRPCSRLSSMRTMDKENIHSGVSSYNQKYASNREEDIQPRRRAMVDEKALHMSAASIHSLAGEDRQLENFWTPQRLH